MLVPHCFNYYSFVVSFEFRMCISSNFVLRFKELLIISCATEDWLFHSLKKK